MNSLKAATALFELLDYETMVLLFLFVCLCFLFYRFFLTKVSLERHGIIKNHFKNLTRHLLTFLVLYLIYTVLHNSAENSYIFRKLALYTAAVTYFWGALVFVKTSRLFALQYLFLGSMRAGVPLLLVNIFSLLISMGIVFWTLSYLFEIQLGPIFATSAAFSIILGLALQDTLGNLFAGISMQLDKTFEMGDWLEIQNGSSKIIGQVTELTWRSTELTGLSDETIILPNKLVASSQVSNFSPHHQSILRSHVFKVKFEVDAEKAKDILENALSQISDVKGIPAPFAYVQEINESWIAIKIIYFIDNYGKQFVIGDKVLNRCRAALTAAGIPLAHQILEVIGSK